ncbi:MAG: helix-turn-helix transcriptional regulator [Oscillospiraceae bacterium]|nr:helix-turn-helix transcriptional regulator [Oscillospiraceae bacterium]
MFDPKIFGQRLLLLRKQCPGVTQADISKLLEVTPTQISDMENGNSATTMARLCLLCDYFNVSADYLLGRTDIP